MFFDSLNQEFICVIVCELDCVLFLQLNRKTAIIFMPLFHCTYPFYLATFNSNLKLGLNMICYVVVTILGF